MLYIKSKEVNNLGYKTQRIIKYIRAELRNIFCERDSNHLRFLVFTTAVITSQLCKCTTRSHTQYGNKWVLLHSIKTLFTKMNSRLDLAQRPEFSDSFSKVSVQQYIWQFLRNGRIYFKWPLYLLLWERIT